MDKQKSTPYSSRFNAAAKQTHSQTAPRTSVRQSDAARRPSGFGTAGQTRKVKPAPEPELKKESKPKIDKSAKKKAVRKERDPGKNHPVLRILLAILVAAVLVSVLMVLIFGGEDTTYHQMPTIERESIAHFEPEATSVPGAEGL